MKQLHGKSSESGVVSLEEKPTAQHCPEQYHVLKDSLPPVTHPPLDTHMLAH